ncbi:VIR protein [Plasmodium vivax]|uniref:VIR protein n=1 Tax=Plasmodium vivax TaxID=5855 RepID=A0A1G4E938_PLAVI|nr:VIR protein [Plasmodium vivax]
MEYILGDFQNFFFNYKSIFNDNLNNYYQKYSQKCQKSGPIYIGDSGSFSLPCIKCMKYLENLDRIYDDGNHEKQQKEGILYLFLWIYDVELRKEIYNGESLNIYEKLLTEYGEIRGNYDTNIPNFFHPNIEKTLNSELKDLYHLYYKFYKLKLGEECRSNNGKCAKECSDLYHTYKTSCDSNNQTDFCTKLDSFWKEHAAYINESITCNGNNICLLYLRNPFLSVILTIVFITSTITIILFILYKFTPLGSRIRTRRKSKKNIWNNVDQEMYNIADYTEMSNNNSKKKPYNLAYQSKEHSL